MNACIRYTRWNDTKRMESGGGSSSRATYEAMKIYLEHTFFMVVSHVRWWVLGLSIVTARCDASWHVCQSPRAFYCVGYMNIFIQGTHKPDISCVCMNISQSMIYLSLFQSPVVNHTRSMVEKEILKKHRLSCVGD